jgi:hypothetical protein
MINESYQFYIGEYIKNLGIPIIVLVGVETEDEFICQRFIIIENPQNNTFDKSLCNVVKMRKAEFPNYNLDFFINEYGIEQSKTDLYYKALENNNYENTPRINISKNSETSILMSIKNKSVENLNFIIEKCISEKLKMICTFYKKLTFEVRKL